MSSLSKVAPGGGDIFPDLHQKMSKKIAQLTKVIYHLNTKNEDHNTELENLAASSQLELQQVVRDAAQKFAKFKEAIDTRQQQVNVEAAMATLQKKFAAEKEAAQKDFQAYKIKVSEREQRITIDFQKKYDVMNDDVTAMNQRFVDKTKAFESAAADFKRQLDEARNSGSSGLQEMRKKYENEIAELVQSSNSKFQDMLVQQLGKQEEQRRQADATLAQSKIDVAAETTSRLQGEHDVALGQLRAQLKGEKEEAVMSLRRELDEKLQQQREDLMGKLEKALAELRSTSDEVAALRKEKEKLESTIRDLTAQLEETHRNMGDKLGGSEARLQQLSASLSQEKTLNTKLTAELREREEEIERLHRLLKEKNSKLVELEGAVEVRDKEIASLKRDLEVAQAGLAAVDRTLQDKLRASEKTSDALRDEIAQLVKSVADRDNKISDLERTAVRLAAEHQRLVATLQQDKDNLLQQLKEHSAHLASSGEKAQAEVDRLSQRLRELEASSKKELQDLVDKYEKTLESMREAARNEQGLHQLALEKQQEQYAAKEATLLSDAAATKRQLEAQLRDAQDTHAAAIADLQSRHYAEVETLKIQLTQLEAQLSVLSEQQDGERNTMRSEMSKLESKAKAYKAELEAKKKESERAESVQTGLKNQIEALREELKASQKAYRDKMDMGLAKVEADWQTKLDSLKETHEFQIREIEALAEVNKNLELKEQSRQHEEEMQILKNALSQEAAKAASEQGSAERLRVQLEADLREEKLGRKTEVASLTSRHADEIKQLTTKQAAEIDEIHKSHSASSSAQANRTAEEHATALAALEAQMVQLRVAHSEELASSLAASAAGAEQAKKQALSLLESHLVDSHTKAMQSCQEQHARVLSELKREADAHMEHMIVERDHMEQTLNMTLASLSATEKALTDEKSESARRLHNFTQEKEQLSRDAEMALRKEKENSQRALMEAMERAAADTRLLKDEFTEDRIRFDERIAEAAKELEAMEQKYRNRESRGEDLARIAALEQELIDKDELVAKTREEMLYFKREMLNREESYNVKFNAKPNVGVMQVLKTKDDVQPGGVKSSKPTRVVQPQPGMGMGMPGLGMGMGMGIGNSAPPPGIPQSGANSGSTKMPPLPRSK